MMKIDKTKFYKELIEYTENGVNFTNKRINQKYYQLVKRYEKRIRKEEIYGFCLDIIIKFIQEKEYIRVAEEKGANGYKDDITTIVVMMDTRIDRLIDEWLGTERYTVSKKEFTVSPPYFESLEKPVRHNEDDDKVKRIKDIALDENNVFYKKVDTTNEEIDRRLDNIYKQANLTDTEINVLQALERTSDNVMVGQIYDRTVASEYLGCGRTNVSNHLGRIKKKVQKTYNKNTRQERLLRVDSLLEKVKGKEHYEKDIINYILSSRDSEMILYIMYDKIDSKLTQYFNINSETQLQSQFVSSKMTKFCDEFVKELKLYRELIQYNIDMEEKGKESRKNKEVKEIKEYKDNTDINIYVYMREDKLDKAERKGRHVVYDGEIYYYSRIDKQTKDTRKSDYRKGTYL